MEIANGAEGATPEPPAEGPGTQAGTGGQSSGLPASDGSTGSGGHVPPGTSTEPAGSLKPPEEGQARGPDGKFLGKDGQPIPEKKPEPPAAPKRWKLGDKEFESPDELATAAERLRLEKDEATHYRQFVEQAAERAKKTEELEKRLKADPWAVLKDHGHDPRTLALLRVRQEMEEAKRFEGLSDEQITLVKRTEALEQELANERAERKQEKEARTAEAVKLYTQARAQHYIGVINKAFELSPELPKTGEVQARLVAELKRCQKYKYDIPPDLLGRKVLEDLQKEHASWDTDERFNAKDFVKRHPKRAEAIRAAYVESLQTPQSGAKPPPNPGPTPLSREPVPKPEVRELLTPEEADAIIRKRISS